mmetsp:Transcript_136901/g.381635  ORF Transcript_136901/g.381635 Transcript_136901/m.381635 type:complete len:193 (-) Transcript_136901:111-689(-)
MGLPQVEVPGVGIDRAYCFQPSWNEDADLHDRIRNAQLRAGRPGAVSPKSLLGKWTDSYGNAISVRTTDAFGLHLTATLSRPPRPDIHLKFRPVDIGAGWLCGDATLDATLGPAGAAPRELFWSFPSGDVSLWVRAEDQHNSVNAPWSFDDHQNRAEAYVVLPCVPQTVWVPQTVLVPQGAPVYLDGSPTHC